MDTLNYIEKALIKIAVEEKIGSLKSHIVDCEKYNIDTESSTTLVNYYKDLLDKLQK